jgi:hypothetical protein
MAESMGRPETASFLRELGVAAASVAFAVKMKKGITS